MRKLGAPYAHQVFERQYLLDPNLAQSFLARLVDELDGRAGKPVHRIRVIVTEEDAGRGSNAQG